MLFASLIFIFRFLSFVLLAYACAKTISRKNLVLLIASIYFYFWGETWNILILGFTFLNSYCFAIWIDQAPTPKKRKLCLRPELH